MERTPQIIGQLSGAMVQLAGAAQAATGRHPPHPSSSQRDFGDYLTKLACLPAQMAEMDLR